MKVGGKVMSILWKCVEEIGVSDKAKRGLFLLSNSLLCSVIGFFIWVIVSRFALSTLDWALCFTGYPGILIGFIGGYIFLSRK